MTLTSDPHAPIGSADGFRHASATVRAGWRTNARAASVASPTVGSAEASTTSPVTGTVDRLRAEIARDGEGAAVQHDPALLLVVVDAHVVQPRVGEVGLVVPQRDQAAVQLPSRRACSPASTSSQFSLDRSKRLGVLRVGDLVGVPAVLGELGLAALGGGPGQLRFGVGGEELERARRAPLLAHEQHCGVGRSEHQRGLDRELADSQVLRRPVTDGAVADLVVGQRCRPAAGWRGWSRCPAGGRAGGAGTTSTCPRGSSRSSAWSPASASEPKSE